MHIAQQKEQLTYAQNQAKQRQKHDQNQIRWFYMNTPDRRQTKKLITIDERG